MAGRKPDRLPNPAEEKEPFYMRWPAIVIALLLIWPIGLILLITKIIGVARRTRAEKTQYDPEIPFTKQDRTLFASQRSRQKKRLVTVCVMTALFLVVGCLGLTRDYIRVFRGEPITGKFVVGVLSDVLFLLVGLYIAASGYRLLLQQRRVNQLVRVIGGNRTVSIAWLQDRTGCDRATLLTDADMMLNNAYFGHGAYYDAETEQILCVDPEWLERNK